MLTTTQLTDLRTFLARVVPRGPVEEHKLSSILTALEDYGTRSSTQPGTGTRGQQ